MMLGPTVLGRRLRSTVEVGVLAIALLALPAVALAKMPYFSVEVSPSEPTVGRPIVVEVRLWGDAGHVLAGREDESAMSFAEASPVIDGVLVARADGSPDVAVTLRRAGLDTYQGTLWLPAGGWTLIAFPDRSDWATPSVPPGYPDDISFTVSAAAEYAIPCPVTPPGEAPADFAERLFGSGSAFGNDDLWVGGLGPDGVIVADARSIEPDGSVGWKLGWWRIAPGKLTITGRRLDAPAPPLRGEAGDGYGISGFQASGVYFPTEGCWEVTGTVGDVTLTFVTFVLKT